MHPITFLHPSFIHSYIHHSFIPSLYTFQYIIQYKVFTLKKMDQNDKEKDEDYKEQNLINQFIIYGVLNIQNLTIEDILKNEIKVGVLQHYTNGEITTKEDQNQFYQMWAYPDGIKIYDTRLKIINDSEPQHSFGKHHNITIFLTQNIQENIMEKPHDYIYSFVHTDYELNRTYFTALCWHQKKYCPITKERLTMLHNRNIYSHRLPKCTLWELQNDPLMRDFNKQLVYIPKVIIISSKYPLFQFHKELLKFYYRNVLNQTNDLLINQQEYTNFKELIHLIGYPEAQNYYDSQKYHQLTKKSKKIKYKRIKKQNLNDFYTAFFFLPKLNKEINQIQIIDCFNSSIKFSSILFNKNLCFYKPNIDILAIIKKIGINNLISLWKSLILQRHILIFSMNNLHIIQLCQTLFYLLQPIRWQNIYIPYLPIHLVNNIDAILSYIIGMSKIHMDYVISHFKMKDIILFDLDNNVIIENGGKNDIQLPLEISQLISVRLQPIIMKKQEGLLYFFKHKSDDLTLNQQQKILKIKQIFFDALLYLLNNYRSFSQLNQSDLLNFDREGYKKMFIDQKWSVFAGELVNTMIFIRLCQYHLYKQKILKWNQYSIGGFFVYCQNILSKKYKEKTMWQVPKPEKDISKLNCPYYEYLNYVMKNDVQKLKKKKTYEIEHYLIKYLNYKELIREEESNYKIINTVNKKSFFNVFIDFLFPWLEEIQKQCKQQNKEMNQRSSQRFSINRLLNLQCIFGERKPQSSNTMNIQKLFLQYKEKKNSYLDYKLLESIIHNKERISV